MKAQNFNLNGFIIFISLGILLVIIPFTRLRAQDDCEITKYHGNGYSTTITSVTDNGNNSHTIVLTVEHDGCAGDQCKAMNHYSIEADEGSYSDISVINVYGQLSYGGINMGPNLGGDPFDGFRVSNTSGIGNGQAGVFTVTYTLTGGLQDQQTLVKAGSNKLTVSFTMEEFQSVLDCIYQNIFPYYSPPEGGKNYDLIGAELTSLYHTYITYDSVSSNDIFIIIDTDVMIEVHAQDGQYDDLLTLLKTPAYGLTNEVGDPDNLLITGQYPIENLLLLNDLPLLINFVRPVYPAITNVGLVTSQGDTSMRSHIARSAFNVNGDGVKVGVLSDSYNTQLGDPAADDVLRGDLPGPGNSYNTMPVEVLADYPYGSGSDEGRAMLQIIHDIAPGADLAFRTGFLGASDFALGIRELQEAGCDVIVDDITYITEPFLKDGIIAQAVDAVADSGVAYFSAAGNFGNQSYHNSFFESNPPAGMAGMAHDFTGGSPDPDIYQSISLTEGSYTIVLQWDDGSDFSSTNTDLDIFLANDNGTTLFGFNRINTGGAPLEVCPFTVEGDSAHTNILIINNSGTPNVFFKLIVFRGNILFNEYNDNGASTIVGHPNAEGAVAVGAVNFIDTPEYGVDPPIIAPFSSWGGTPVDGVTRNKPEISAPNGANTSVDFGAPNIDGDLFPNFFGTSAAAPHAAGVAALLVEAKSRFYDESLSLDDLRTILQSTSIDMHSTGYDSLSGHGFIQADAALQSLANPSPVITTLSYDTTSTLGVEPVDISVSGNYLTEGSEIYFNGSPLDSGSVVQNDTLLTGTVPIFTELYPPIQVFNPPNAQTNGTDGGLSNPLYFTTKKTIIVSIDDKTKTYGEVIPDFTASYMVESVDTTVTLESEEFSEEEIARITGIPFETVANELSNVGIWEIVASASDPLNPQSNIGPTDSLDIALLNKYNFHFERGLLTIEKMDLLIVPKDTTITYGDPLSGFEYEYHFNNEQVTPGFSIDINPDDSQAILNQLQLSHATALVNGIGLVRATALVNSEGDPLLDSATLVNRSVVISNAVFLGSATALVNGTLIDPQAFLDATFATPGEATALVNGIGLVRATALVNGTAFAVIGGTATALVNSFTLSLATALVNTTTVSQTNNEGAILLLGEDDIDILANDSSGSIELNSISIITGNTVGEHFILPGSLLSKNFNISYGLGKIIVEPDTATISIDQESLIQTYSGDPKEVSVNTDPSEIDIQITYDGDTIPPVNAGSYLVVATVTDPNYIGSGSDTLVIEKAFASVTFSDLEQTYDGSIKTVSANTVPGGLIVNVTYDGDNMAPINAGTYEVTASVGDPNYSGNATDLFTIVPVIATVTADTKVVSAGDPAPEFTATFAGFVNGEDESVVTDLSFTLSPEYTGSAGSHEIIPEATALNYIFTSVSGILYVNPFGPGTKHIKPNLICVEELDADSLGFGYIAHFEYENDNATDVFIFRGDDNFLSSQGSYYGDIQPELFLSGGGTFDVLFDGVKLTWTVSSYKHNGHKTSVASNASSKSSKCHKSGLIDTDGQEISEDGNNEYRVYPNPTEGKVYIDLNDESISDNDITIFDQNGRICQVKVNQSSNNLLELEMSGMNSGIYFIKINVGEAYEVFRIIKH